MHSLTHALTRSIASELGKVVTTGVSKALGHNLVHYYYCIYCYTMGGARGGPARAPPYACASARMSSRPQHRTCNHQRGHAALRFARLTGPALRYCPVLSRRRLLPLLPKLQSVSTAGETGGRPGALRADRVVHCLGEA